MRKAHHKRSQLQKEADHDRKRTQLQKGIDLFSSMDIASHAAHAGYFIILSVFPTIVLLLGILRYTKLSVNDLTNLLDGAIPYVLTPWIDRLVSSAYANSSLTVVSVAAVVALWSASRGVYALAVGLNAVYGVSDRRNWLHRRMISMGYTFVFLIVLLLTLVLHVFGNTILNMLPESDNPVILFLMDVLDFRFFLLLIVQTVMFVAIYSFLPGVRNRIRDSVPGALLASLGWLIFSDLFSLYVENFDSYATIYGSVYAVVLSMLWLYCCLFIVFCGGALNRLLSRNSKNG